MSNPILSAKDISITFGALKAVTDFNLEIKKMNLWDLLVQMVQEKQRFLIF